MTKCVHNLLTEPSLTLYFSTATAVDAAAKDFTTAFDAKDSVPIGSLYAKDAIAFPPNSEMVKGRDAIQAFWKGLIDAGMKATVEIVETQSEGNLGFEVGKYTILDASGKTIDQGKYVVVWKKVAEGWKLYRDIWNTNMEYLVVHGHIPLHTNRSANKAWPQSITVSTPGPDRSYNLIRPQFRANHLLSILRAASRGRSSIILK